MKICFVYNSIFNPGGIQRCITNLANYLKTKGHDITILCTDSSYPTDRKMYGLDDDIKVVFSKKITILKKILCYYRKIFIYLNRKYGVFRNNLSVLKKIYYPHNWDIEKIINNNNFDYVISCATYFNALVSFLNLYDTKTIGWQHSSHKFYFENGFYKNQDAVIKNMFTKLDKYVVLTDFDKDMIKKDYDFVPTRIYNANNFELENVGSINNKKFIAIGRLDSVKRFDLLIKNFYEFHKVNKEWILEIVGSGKEKSCLEKLICELNLSDYVFLTTFTNKIYEKYLSSSIYCMTSLSEGLPMVVIEAMEAGLPVISYDIPCMVEIIKNNGGVIINEGDNSEYVNQMLKISSDEDLYKSLSIKVKKKVKEFKIDKIGKEWIYLLESLKEGKNNDKKNKEKIKKIV